MSSNQMPEGLASPSAPTERAPDTSVARHAGIVSFFTMLSRIGGLVRDMVFAHLFGATHATDAFLMAFTIPNTFRMLVAEGSLTVAFLPVFNETQRKKGEPAAREMMAQAIGVFPGLSAILTALGIVFAEPLVRVFANGFDQVPGKFELTVELTRWMFPFLCLISFVALAMGALNARKRFASSAASPLLFNIIHVASMVTLAQVVEPPLLGVAFGVLLGGVAQVVLQAWALRGIGLWVRPRVRFGPEIQRILRLMLPAVLALGVYQINILVLRHFASYMGKGAVTYLYNADRFLQLPLGVFGIAIATAALPAFSDAHEDNDRPRLIGAFVDAMRLTSFISVPASVGLVVLALPIIVTVFQHGEFTHSMARETAAVLVTASLGLVAISAIRVAGKVFFAIKDFKTPVACSTVGLASNVAFAPIFGLWLGVAGLALSVTVSAWLQLLMQLLFLRFRLGPLGMARVILGLLRDVAASLPMGAAVWLSARELGDWSLGFTFFNVMALAVLIGLGVVVFVVSQVALRSPELSMLWGGLRRRLRR